MIDVNDATLDAFKSSQQKNLVLSFDDGTIVDNNSIKSESMTLTQTLCDEETLVYGKCSANSFSIDVKASNIRYKGKRFTASVSCDGNSIKLGTFTVHSDNINDDGIYRHLECYDDMFTVSDLDVTSWYNALSFPITMKNFRTSLINHLGWEQEEQNLCNDDMTIEKTVNVIQLSAVKVLESICELNACFGKIDSEGKFRYIELDDVREAVYPKTDLYPSEDLYPRTDASDTLQVNDYYLQTLTYEEYQVEPVTQVKIRENIDDLGTVVGTEGNLYTIEGNILCYGKTETELQTIAQNFLSIAELVWYQPFNLECKGRPWLECGDFIKVVGNKGIVRSVILHRVLSGITALRDNYSSQGLELYPLNNTSIQSQLEAIRGATVEVKKDVDGLSVEVKKKVDNEELSSAISQSSESIMVEVRKKVGADEVISTINLSPDRIYLRGNRLVIESTNFSLDENGNVEVTGDINAQNLLFHDEIKMVKGNEYYSSDETTVVGLQFSYGVETPFGTDEYYNLKVGTNSNKVIGRDGQLNKHLTNMTEIAGNLHVDGYIDNGFTSLGSGWYRKRLSANQYEYIYQGSIGSGSFSAYGNWYYMAKTLSFPESISTMLEFNANVFSNTGLYSISMYGYSSNSANFYISSAKTETSNLAINFRMIATK